tara:strand:+ start:998 stop:1615 length:618 start_codon:yes stop_codon:yes gene_type:complete
MTSTKITSEVEEIINTLLYTMYNYQKENLIVRECCGNTTTFMAVFKTIFPLISIKAINCIILSDYHEGIPQREHMRKRNGSAIITHMMVEITDGEKTLQLDPSWETSRDKNANYFSSYKVFCDNMKHIGKYEKNKEFMENDLLENFVEICKSAKKANSYESVGNNQQILYGADGEKISKDQLNLMIQTLNVKYKKRKNKYIKKRR